jgi:2-methylaconitate cis-trans-isomerase PrpF
LASAPQIKIPAVYMRGGTSKGVFFRLQDLPAAARQSGPARDALLLRVIGSPDPTPSRSTAWARPPRPRPRP